MKRSLVIDAINQSEPAISDSMSRVSQEVGPNAKRPRLSSAAFALPSPPPSTGSSFVGQANDESITAVSHTMVPISGPAYFGPSSYQCEFSNLPFNCEYDGINLTHYCGAVCLAWLNPWHQVKAVLDGSADPSTLSPLSHPSGLFVRYVARILKESQISSQVANLALLLIYRFRRMSPNTPVVGHSSSELRIIVAALMVANKCFDDISYTTKSWVQFSRLPSDQICRMEYEFISGLDFRTHVTRAQWRSWSRAVKILFAKVSTFASAPVADHLAFENRKTQHTECPI